MPRKAIDMHCDTLMRLAKSGDLDENRKSHVSLKGLRDGGVVLQCFADFVPTGILPKFCRQAGNEMIYNRTYKKYQKMMAYNKDNMFPVLYAADLDKLGRDNKIGVLLTIEDGGVLGSDLKNVQKVYDQGVRLITLTWNFENAIGSPNSKDEEIMKKGLTPFGKEVVHEMERLGIVVDISHVSDGVFWDVAEVATKPFLASHSNARAICNHTRNMTDDMIRTLAQKGGVMGLNLGPEFVGAVKGVTRMEDLVAQIQHIRSVGGVDVLALGSDFDGIHGDLAVAGPQDWPKLEAALSKAGFTDDDLEKMWNKNALRVFRSVLA